MSTELVTVFLRLKSLCYSVWVSLNFLVASWPAAEIHKPLLAHNQLLMVTANPHLKRVGIRLSRGPLNRLKVLQNITLV